MEWILIDKANLFKGEVLAANFQEGSWGYKGIVIGYLYIVYETVIVESDYAQLMNCTHYIEMSKFNFRRQ